MKNTSSRFYIFILSLACAVILISKLVAPYHFAEHEQTSGIAAVTGHVQEPERRPARRAQIRAPRAVESRSLPIYRTVEEAPAWAVPYGKEFWKQSTAQPAVSPAEGAPVNFNLGRVIERVSHAITAGEDNVPAVKSKAFSAKFDASGLRFSPYVSAVAEDGTPMLQAQSQTEAVFRTASIRMGDDIIFGGGQGIVEGWSLLGNTAQRLLNAESGMIEHYEIRSEGVEVSWIMNYRPTGSGHLEVEAGVEGVHYVGTDANGHHYANDQGIPCMRIGNAVLIDARGMQTDLFLVANDGRLNIQVTEQMLANAVFPIVIDPTISPEFGMGVTMATGDQDSVAIASNGTNYLVVWNHNTTDIYGTRVSSVGEVLDVSGLGISTGANTDILPDVASNGSDYLVVWERGDIYGTRVTSSGVVLDTNGIAICSATNTQTAPAVTALGTNYLIAWEDFRANAATNDIYGARVTAGGLVLDADSVAISTAANNQLHPVVSANGTNALVVWADKRVGTRYDIYSSRVTSLGVVLDASGILVYAENSNGVRQAVASNGTNWLVGWENGQSGSGTDIYGARIGSDGSVLDTNVIVISGASAFQTVPALASDANNYFVVWQDSRNVGYDIYGARVSGGGSLLDSNGVAICAANSDQNDPAIVSLAGSYLAVWTDERNASTFDADIYGSRITAAAEVLDLVAVSTAAAEDIDQTLPAVASNGTDYLVAWEDDRNLSSNGLDIFATRVRSDGVIMDVSGISICTVTNKQQTPAVRGNGSDYLVAWTDWRGSTADIYGARVSSTGTVSDTNGFAVSTAASTQDLPAVGNLGSDYFVAWQDLRTTSLDIYGSRVTGSGVVLDTNGIAIGNTAGSQRTPEVSGIQSNYFVVYASSEASAAYDIFGSRVSTNGSVLDTSGFAICTNSAGQLTPNVATDGTNYLVVWQDQRNTASSRDIYGIRVSAGALLLDADLAICTATNIQENPAVASSASGYLVAWGDRRVSSAAADLYGGRVTSAGSVLDTDGFLINAGASSQNNPGVASDGSKYLVVYRSLTTSTNRVRANLITP